MGRVGHPRKGQPYHEINSRRGIDAVAGRGLNWVDLDSVPAWSDVLEAYVSENEHWPRPLMYGFTDPLHAIERGRRTINMNTTEVERLRAPGGYRIRPTVSQYRYAASRGVNVLDEKKYAKPFESVQLHRREQAAVDHIRLTKPAFRVVVAILSTHPRAVHVLKAAKAAGRTTCLLAQSDYPASWAQYADFKRGTGKAVPTR